MTLTGTADAERVNVAPVTPELMPPAGARATVGRLFDVGPLGAFDRQQVVIGTADGVIAARREARP